MYASSSENRQPAHGRSDLRALMINIIKLDALGVESPSE